jgi:predicted ATPase
MFRIEYLKLQGHTQLGNLELLFSENNEKDNDSRFYSTVIIGPNGTGKSYILRALIDLFREIYELKSQGKRRKYLTGKYIIKYFYNGHQYCYSNILDAKYQIKFQAVPGGKAWREKGMTFYLEKDEKLVNSNEIELPYSILANSIMLTDKYIFTSKKEDFNIYKYLGVRTTPSTAGTRSYIKNIIDLLIGTSDKKKFTINLKGILTFLELEEYLNLSYSVRRKDIFFTGDLNTGIIIDYINQYDKKLKDRSEIESKTIVPRFSFSPFKKLLEDKNLLDEMIMFCNEKSKSLQKNQHTGNNYFDYNILNDLEKLSKEYSLINLLYKLDLISFPELCFKKREENPYSYEGASSGEVHFVTSLIGILATIKDNSLILIDEPEISLHPNWQMKYMSFLNEVFKEYSNCHFIIATHSHFLISDLKGESSKIVGLKRKDGKIITVDIPPNLNTYGWSAEDVLFRIFQVKSTRNHYFEMAVAELLELLYTKSRDKDKIGKILKDLKKLEISYNDPLRELIEETEDYLENDKSNN